MIYPFRGVTIQHQERIEMDNPNVVLVGVARDLFR
jgi:hypothetical protein